MDDAPDLIERLLVIAGIIMEDTAEAALVADPSRPLGARIEQIANAGSEIVTITAAAALIARRYADSGSTNEHSHE